MNINIKYLLSALFALASFSFAVASDPPFLKYKNDNWVRTQLEKMSLDEKIAQLLMITVYPEQGEIHKQKIIQQIEKFKPGGILVMQGAPVETAKWLNEFQLKSKTPVLMAIDGEWGPAMRTDSVMAFPFAQAIGAVTDSAYIEQMGFDMGNQLKMLGIHMNFAPVADINTNPANPVINFRSFGENKIDVAKKAWWISKGMQKAGVIAVAKHFPGHGDTSTDSHKTLPYLSHSKTRMDTLETFPFRYLSKNGIGGIMTAHLNIPSLDNSETPSSLSKKIVDGYLKKDIGFKGLIVTDAINMRGVRTAAGNAELNALLAGNDLVEFVPDIEAAINSIKNGVLNGMIAEAEINEKCTKILAAKRWCGLNKYETASIENLSERLNSPYSEVTIRKLIKGSLTVLTNKNCLPVQGFDTLKLATLTIGDATISEFQQMIEKYVPADHFAISKYAGAAEWKKLKATLKNYNLVIGGMQGINLYPSVKYGITDLQQTVVSELVAENRFILAFFGNAYALKHLENIQNAHGLILAYQNNRLTHELAAQLIFGAFEATGKLPVTVDHRFKCGNGVSVKKNNTFSYTIPEETGIKSSLLERKIDSLANLGIDKKAYPGCQVLVAKNGNVIFHKCYGFHTYENEKKVQPTDLYDLASITKVTASLPAIMKMVDENKMDPEAPFSAYWPDFRNTDKEKFRLSEALTHQAGLTAWIPFWMMALDDDGNLDSEIFKDQPADEFDVRVSEKLYMNRNFKQAIFDTIRNSKFKPEKKYVYSDLSFIIYPKIIENISGEGFESYLMKNFYSPLGAGTLTYNPYKHYPIDRMIPTETDELFRHETIQGFVHDEAAAMLGGVSGHAGLFGTANDLAKVFQMYLQKGYFGGRRYITEKTINEFTRIRFPENGNRRGLGFDKPLIGNNRKSLGSCYPAYDTSPNSFGHSGFTGTFVWADPDNGLLYVFLSNRVYPTRENEQLYGLNIRTAMHQEIYNCIKTGLN